MPGRDTRPRSLKGVIDAISAADGILSKERSELISGIRTACRCFGRDPSEIDANPAAIRALAKYSKKKLAGVSDAHFRNSMSRLRRALTFVGIAVDRRRDMPLGEPWVKLLTGLPDMERVNLRKFVGWCSARGRAPADVDATVFDHYLAFLEEQSIQHNVRERWHRARRAWNKAVAVEGSGYPKIESPLDDRERLISVSELPPQFGLELQEFKKALTQPLSIAMRAEFRTATKAGALAARLSAARYKPLSDVTAEGYARNLVLLVGYLVLDGIGPGHFTSVSALLDADLVARGLERIQNDVLARKDGRHKSHPDPADLRMRGDPNVPLPIVTAVAYAVLSLAKHCKAPPEVFEPLKTLAASTRVKRTGMTPKNKARLAQFAIPEAKALLLYLPRVVLARYAGVAEPTFMQAREVQDAAILTLMIELPLRVKNIALLDLDRHFLRPPGGEGKWLISIPAFEVKNDVEIDGELTEETSWFLQRYVSVFRPALANTSSGALFVSRTGDVKRRNTVSRQFSQFIRREIGFALNPHLMRHLAANTWLDAFPEDIETARQLLGHKSPETTRLFYAGLDQRRSFRRYHEVIDEVRNAARPIAFEFGRKRRKADR
jgi:site-specific recombinase XerD